MALMFAVLPVGAAPVGSGFTYQGRLVFEEVPVNSPRDLEFGLYSDAGVQVGTTVTLAEVPVVDGYFSARLDFGAGAFGDEQRLLQIGVKEPGTSAYIALQPRLEISPAPVALSVAANGVTNKSISPESITRDKVSPDFTAHFIASTTHFTSYLLPSDPLEFHSVTRSSGFNTLNGIDIHPERAGLYQVSLDINWPIFPDFSFTLHRNGQATPLTVRGEGTVAASKSLVLWLEAGDSLRVVCPLRRTPMTPDCTARIMIVQML